MGKVNSLFEIANQSFIKDKKRKTVSEHCLENPPVLDTDYLAKLKKLNKKKKVPIDDLLVVAMVNGHHKLPPDELVRFAGCIPEMMLQTTLAMVSKQNQLDKQALALIEKNQLTNHFLPATVGEFNKNAQLQTAKIAGRNQLQLTKPVISGHRIAEIILKRDDPLFTVGKFGDIAYLEKANLKTKVAANTASEQNNLLLEKQPIGCKTDCLHGLQPNIWGQQHVESTVAGSFPDRDVDSLFVKDTEQENNETQKLPLSLITTMPFYEQNNVSLVPINKHKTEDRKMSSILNRSMTETNNQFQTSKTSFSSEDGGMRYHFNKWQGDHSVKIQFNKIADHHIYLSPSNLIVEKQLSEHLNQLPAKFKVHISDENEPYRYKQSQDEAYDEKDKE